ncbi:hypothetical protein [Bacteroides sp. 1001136B_160425_E2]|uniref:hypothetical protein n=1 Tax=Bacteroides sp. 1001136B_160425_E2 TaxID=2787083 RepID=UPI00293D3C87|nr:hypothetical protein [Bacteroides sp. 1001136B_160425_E2]
MRNNKDGSHDRDRQHIQYGLHRRHEAHSGRQCRCRDSGYALRCAEQKQRGGTLGQADTA